MMIGCPSPILPNRRGDAIGQLETASGNLCTATLISPHIALTAGHCLLTPPKGKPDKAVALRFVARKGVWRYEIHGIEGRVEPSLGRRLKADGDGWIVPPAAGKLGFWSGNIALPHLPVSRQCLYLPAIKRRSLRR
ncbi:Putative protease ydgD [Salmonella enterica subsp. enterica]|uniref:Protease ydgD n=1 Tax=Salmonella enterica I TaxID=59201 RepID=A0A447MT40_SALET|nr:Putative protease ydgD [Salmonella enterica subsp. enterica]